jgi:hypothetical protein
VNSSPTNDIRSAAAAHKLAGRQNDSLKDRKEAASETAEGAAEEDQKTQGRKNRKKERPRSERPFAPAALAAQLLHRSFPSAFHSDPRQEPSNTVRCYFLPNHARESSFNSWIVLTLITLALAQLFLSRFQPSSPSSVSSSSSTSPS